MSIDDEIIRDPNQQPVKKKAKKKSGGEGLNSNAFKIGIGCVVLLLLLIVLGGLMGWFGGGSGSGSAPPAAAAPTPGGGGTSAPPPPPAATPSDSSSAPPPMPPANYTEPPSQGGSVPGQPGMMQGGPYGEYSPPGQPPAKPPLPEDFRQWSAEDYQRAREESHPKLIEAVGYVGEHFKKDNAAQGLANLLKPLKPPENTPGQPPQYYPGSYGAAQPGLIEAIIFALGDNGTKTARQTILDILKGKCATDDERTAVGAALKVLVTQQTAPEFEAALLEILIEPEKFRPQDPANPLPPNELQNQVLEAVKSQASEEFRKTLARRLTGAYFTPNHPLIQFLLTEDPLNLEAQLVLYQNEDLPPETKAQLEQYFLNYGSKALEQMLGIPANAVGLEGMPGAGYSEYPSASYAPSAAYGPSLPSRPPSYPGSGPYGPPATMPSGPAAPKLTEAEQALRLAKRIWTGPLAASLPEKLDDLRGLEKHPNTILLAATIPTPPLRTALYKLLKKRGLDGPQSLEAAGLTDRVVTDPGMLVLVKLQPRKDRQGVQGGRPGGYYPPPNYGGPGGDRVDPQQKRQQAEQEWFNVSLRLLNSWRARFYATARAQEKAARKGEPFGESAPEKPEDVELPEGSKIESAFQLNWPEKAPKELAPAVPGRLKIQYFRVETEGKIKRILAKLRQGLHGGDLHLLESGVWFDVLKTDSERNVKRSIDVAITRADKAAYDFTQRREEKTDLEIEILAVEIEDPSNPPQPPPASKEIEEASKEEKK
ncbi:MAG: hypothetical protein JXB10_14720 [Pirellulales bacterium]|nr:hypothetical protein [Pirellulales bacterium]